MLEEQKEKVLHGLEHCLAGERYENDPCNGCPYG